MSVMEVVMEGVMMSVMQCVCDECNDECNGGCNDLILSSLHGRLRVLGGWFAPRVLHSDQL